MGHRPSVLAPGHHEGKAVAVELGIVTTHGVCVIGTAPNDRAGLYGRLAVTESHPQTPHVEGGARRTGRVTIADELQATIVALVDLSLIVKQVSWNVAGQGGDELCGHLELLVSRLRLRVDEVATRMLGLGHVPNGQSRAVAIETNLLPVPGRRLTLDEARCMLGERIRAVAGQLVNAGESVREDRLTAELLARVRAELEQQRVAITPPAG